MGQTFGHAVAASKLRCVVAAAEAHRALAREICGVIEAEAGALLDVSVCNLPLADAAFDLVLPIVSPDNVEQVAAHLTVWRTRQPDWSVLPLTVGLSEHQLLSLMSAGAFDFATCPCNVQALLARLRRAAGLLPAPPVLPPGKTLAPALRDLVGSSPAFLRQLTTLPTIAGCDAGVLILGETGSGKEAYARAIHETSARTGRPLVMVNCSAIPVELFESELFGHVRGAFTNAYAARGGLVREAEGGTLFLDEIDSLPLSAQAKLLRFLQDMEFRPVGGDATLHANVRVIAASNQDLPELVQSDKFRRDLFFRLNVLTVTLPPLRERTEDIFALALRFTAHFATESKRPTLGLSPQAVKRLLAHDWPGNVRELKHVIERAVLMAETSTIKAEDLDLPLSNEAPGTDTSFRAAKAHIVDAFERHYIERLLSFASGNITVAAQMAKKNRRAFFELIRKHDISIDRFRAADNTERGAPGGSRTIEGGD